MKVKILFFIFSIIILSSCTKDSGLQITAPGKELILEKLNGKTGNNNNYEITFGKESVSIKNTTEEKEYNFDEPIFAIGAIYKNNNINAQQNDAYLLVIPLKNEIYTASINQKTYEAVNYVINIIENEKEGVQVLENVMGTIKKGGTITLENLIANLEGDLNISQSKKEEIKSKFANIDMNNDIGQYQKFQ